MGFKPIKDAHSRVVGVEFEPSLKMLRVVVECSRDENQSLSTEEILEKCKVTQAEWKRWWNDFVIHETDHNSGEVTASKNHFQEWWDSALQIKSGEERALLRHVGMQKALEGNFNFWKEMAKTYGSVSDQPFESPRKRVPFKLPDNATPEQLQDLRQKLMESQRAVGDNGIASMARISRSGPKSSGN